MRQFGFVIVLIACLAWTSAAAAGPDGAFPLPEAASRPVEAPAGAQWIERTVVHPPRTVTRRVPVFETVEVPVYACRSVPVWRDVEVPVTATREVPVYATRQVPIHGPVEVPVFESRSTPVSVSLWNPFGCEDIAIRLWDTCEQVQCGTEVREGIVGWRTEQVPCGTRMETYVVATETRRVQDGVRTERVQTEVRRELRCTGFREETVVVAPARAEVVRECLVTPEASVAASGGLDRHEDGALEATVEAPAGSELRSAR